MDREGSGAVTGEIQCLGLSVGEFALLRPAPTDTVVTIELVEGAFLTNLVPRHVLRSGLPQETKPLSQLFQALVAPQLVTLELELRALSCMSRELGSADKALSRLSFRLTPAAFGQPGLA